MDLPTYSLEEVGLYSVSHFILRKEIIWWQIRWPHDLFLTSANRL